MKIANFSIDRPITISMVMLVLIIVGAVSTPLLGVDLYPDLTLPVASVSTTWSGASPQEVDKQITQPIESAMSTVANVTQIRSSSSQGSSRVIVNFNYGVDLDQAILDMRDKLGRVTRQLPSDAGTPTVSKIDPNSSPIMTLALSGSMDAVELKRLATDVVEPRLTQVDGVASTDVTGGKTREIQILLDPAKMQAYQLGVNQVAQAISANNLSADGGVVYQGDKQINLHIDGDLTNVNDINNIPISLSGGNTIPVKEVATVMDTYAKNTQVARLNGQSSVSIDIMKVSDGNTVQVSNNVREMLEQIKPYLPESIKLMVLRDQADYIKQSIRTVVDHTLFGGVLSILVLYFFLRKIRTTLIIAIVIPISLISTFSLLYFGKQTINTVTLGGLALGLGSLVDFAIVVLESIFRYRTQGYAAIDAAKSGTAEVGSAVVASALSQVAVFAPILFTQGMAQQMFGPMALTVSFSHIAALFGALTLIPMLASRFLKSDDVVGEHISGGRWHPVAGFQRGIVRLTAIYGRLLKWSLNHRKTIIAAMSVMLIASLALIPVIGVVLTPSTDEGKIRVMIQMPTGTKIEATNQKASEVERILSQIPEVDTVFTQIGNNGGIANNASIQVNLKSLSRRNRSVTQVVEEVTQETRKIAGDARIFARAESSTASFGRGGSGGGTPIQVQLSGPDMNVLQKLVPLVEEAVSSVPGTRNVQSSRVPQTPQYVIKVNRERAAHYGLSIDQIISAVRMAYQGTTATQFHTGDDMIDVIVKYPDAFATRVENLSRVFISGQNGAQIALSDVAAVLPGVGPAQITRVNQKLQLSVTADLFNVDQGEAQNEVAAKLAELSLPDGYTAFLGGQTVDMRQSYTALGLALPFAIILVYMVLASQFESLFSPFIIMFSLPPTFIGAALGLFLTHRPISINAMTGMIMLIGIVVNNAIVLVDYTNQLRKRGMSRDEAILQAGPVRLRPILMTTATTVLAMLPLVIGYGEGAETQAPMATVVAFGLTFSTVVTLVLVPVVYAMFDDWAEFMKKRLGALFKMKAKPQKHGQDTNGTFNG